MHWLVCRTLMNWTSFLSYFLWQENFKKHRSFYDRCHFISLILLHILQCLEIAARWKKQKDKEIKETLSKCLENPEVFREMVQRGGNVAHVEFSPPSPSSLYAIWLWIVSSKKLSSQRRVNGGEIDSRFFFQIEFSLVWSPSCCILFTEELIHLLITLILLIFYLAQNWQRKSFEKNVVRRLKGMSIWAVGWRGGWIQFAMVL